MAKGGDGVHVFAIPFPLQGHITPMIDLCAQLAQRGCSITFFIPHRHLPSLSSPQQGGATNTNTNMAMAQTMVGVDDGFPLEKGQALTLPQVWQSSRNMFHHLKLQLKDTQATNINTSKVSCVIGDVLVLWAQDLANDLHVPRVALWTSNAHSFSLYLNTPILESHGFLQNTPYKDNKDTIDDDEGDVKLSGLIPGLPSSFRKRDLPFVFFGLITHQVEIIVRFEEEFQRIPEASHVLINTFYELEPAILAILQNDREKDHSIVPIGPLLPLHTTNINYLSNLLPEDTRCLAWLDTQPLKSVVYISFGSITRLTSHQFQEISAGLEASGQPYLWVTPPHIAGSYNKDELVPNDIPKREQLFPSSDQALMVSWAPQRQVLAHPSVGMFLSHCGWNSVLESMSHGVPILGYPQEVEQNTTCRLITHVWKTGVELKRVLEDYTGKGHIWREDVEMGVRQVMSKQHELHNQCVKMRDALLSANFPSGSSYNNVTTFIKSLKDGNPNNNSCPTKYV